MYVEIVPNRNSPPAILLREGWREGNRTHKRTLANISDWPPHKIATLKRLLRNEVLVSPNDLFEISQTLPHGHVEAVLGTIRKLGLDTMISAKRCRERDLVVAMIAGQLLHSSSKLSMTRLWRTTTLGEELSVDNATEDELYAAMDWLYKRQEQIEKRLAAKHLKEGGVVLYDVTNSSYEGRTCPLAKHGYDKDGKKGLPIIAYGVITDGEGRPIAVSVYPGNTGDSATVSDQTEKLRKRFGLKRIVLVGDRGTLTQAQLDRMKETPGTGWITALRSDSIRRLVKEGALQRSLFDETNLAEIVSKDYPNERLVACFNPMLAEERHSRRESMLEATEKELERLSGKVSRRKRVPMKASEIGLDAGKVLNKYKMGKHYKLTIEDGLFKWERKTDSVLQEAQLDGIYVIRTSEPKESLTTADAVRRYKSLSQVEQTFRAMKGIDILVRPIRHRTEERVPAHIFLCMLAYYVEWHMRRLLAPILFEDTELPEVRKKRDPVLKPKVSASAKAKKASRRTQDGLEVHSFATLLSELSCRAKNTCRMIADATSQMFCSITGPTALQTRAFELLGLLPVKNVPSKRKLI
jgi:transposase